MTDGAAETADTTGAAWGAGIWELASLVTPMAIRVAATLRVADHIAAGRRSSRELARTTGCDADALDRMLRHLVTAGVFRRTDEGYELAPRGEALRDDHPDSVRAWLDLDGALGRADQCLVELEHTIRTGEPAYPVRYGTGFWEELSADPDLSASFDSLMSKHVGFLVDAVSGAYDWGSVGHVVDVGGGDGSLMVGLLTDRPWLNGTVVDLEAPAAAARRKLALASLDERSEVITSSFFDPLPPGADCYVLSAILHDWADEPAVRILRHCADAAGERGRVLVIESVGDDGNSPNTHMDLRMLAYLAGKERGLSAYRELAREAGLRVNAVWPAGSKSIIELVAS
ncbi:methyltransferase [Haloechinothrix sp. LS1_15]|uniref:methyltransferase n=1 Tax=Haloechinothrix sp. LS1_15 TaxID=2652248 RepID=UPI00294878C4|nr:methyltransferase [Haloechinothrix sp. LS1_15]MDV6013558.1 methyltransferase [Haloechinothrix sp. LS1_15]